MKPKHLPRLWCALQGLLPLEAAGSRPHESKLISAPDERPAALRETLSRLPAGPAPAALRARQLDDATPQVLAIQL
ncbi:MAG: hypothetical protein JNN01_01990 [Opitutaceae bacterium]|nr:hypothetical protein [Opitutaceae bacterium]